MPTMALYKISRRPMYDTSDEESQDEDELLKWLKKYGLSKYESALREKEIEYKMIQLLEDDEAKELAELIGAKGLHSKIFVKASLASSARRVSLLSKCS